MNKKILTTIIILLTIISFIPLVQSTDELLSYNFAAVTNFSAIWAQHPSATTDRSATGEVFQPSQSGYVSTITIQIQKAGSPTGHLGMILASSNSTYQLPITTLETSTSTLDVSVLTTSYTMYSFQFTGTTFINSSLWYAFYVYSLDPTGMDSTTNFVKLAVTANIAATKWIYYYSNTFIGDTGNDLFYQISGETTSPTSTPAPTATPANGSHWIWNGTDWVNDDNVVTDTTETLLPILIPIAVIMICAGVGAYFLGKWGFLLGLDVAVVILYVAAPTYMPLWGVILIGVGNIGVLLMTRGE